MGSLKTLFVSRQYFHCLGLVLGLGLDVIALVLVLVSNVVS